MAAAACSSLLLAAVAAALGVVSPSSASAQDAAGAKPPKPPQAAEGPAAKLEVLLPPEMKLPAAAKDFQPAADALPKHVKLAEGMPVVGPKAEKFWNDPAAKGLVDPPKAKHAFALAAEGGKPGTVFVYEYEKNVPANLFDYLGLLFVQVLEERPTKAHPEEHFAAGRFAIVLSFPLGDPASEWFKEHLRTTRSLPAPVHRAECAEIFGAMIDAKDEDDPDAGLAAFAAKQADAARSADCLRLAGLFARSKGDWAQAEKHYRAAWELVRTLKDPLPAAGTFEVATWLGYSWMHLERFDGAISAFRAAKSYGVANEVPGSAVWGPYNLCCALAKAKRPDEAVAELKEAVAANAEIKAHARDDGDLESLRGRDDVKKLLAE
jgi:tetratricopeptide (TPR) repeat protein